MTLGLVVAVHPDHHRRRLVLLSLLPTVRTSSSLSPTAFSTPTTSRILAIDSNAMCEDLTSLDIYMSQAYQQSESRSCSTKMHRLAYGRNLCSDHVLLLVLVHETHGSHRMKSVVVERLPRQPLA